MIPRHFLPPKLKIPRWFHLPHATHWHRPLLLHTEARNTPSYLPLLDQVASRREQARRSLLVQVAGPTSASDLALYCQEQFGPVTSLHFHKNKDSKTFRDFFIVEFASSDSVSSVLTQARHSTCDTGGHPVPVYSPFLWLQGGREEPNNNTGPASVPVFVEEDNENQGLAKVKGMSSVSDQILELWRMSSMTEHSSRLRFLVGRQVEMALSGMFPRAEVLPFGSSVNGFGSCSSDQDMFLVLDPPRDQDQASRLIFHAKGAVYGGDRAQVQRYCEEVAKIIQTFLPGCQDVEKILRARVPIVKYSHQLAGLECDLSMSSSSGLHMSCLLHLWSESDWRVRPLVFLVRRWAKSQSLVKSVRPTYFFTNFSLTMMVVCYLQQVHKMLPTLDQLAQLATEKDKFLCEDNLTVFFLHNIDQRKRQLNLCYDDSTSLSELLHGFFYFYSSLDLENSCLCPITGSTRPKDRNWPKSSALDIVNPLEKELNVSYNINRNAVRLFQEKAVQATEKLSLLENSEEKLKLLHEGVFWLFEAGQKVEEKRFALPRIQDLGLNRQEEKAEDERRREKNPLRGVGSYQSGQSDDNKSKARSSDKAGQEEKTEEETRKRHKARSSDKFRVNALYQVKGTEEGETKVTRNVAVKGDRIEELKVKFLRTRVRSKFPIKL